ncbi:UNVERIFIED_CONTAM: putative aldouronate transport system substrate-binding protein [Acetivibrio alkalicellulosi]
MKNSKRLLVICLCVVLVLSFALSACRQNEENGGGSTTDPNDTGKKTSTDIMEISTFISRAGTTPTADNRIYKKIQEELGVKFNFEFVVGEIQQRVGIMISGGDYPDLIGVQSNEAMQFIDAGAFIPLEDYINDAENYPNLNRHYGPLINRITHVDGHAYIMPNFGVHYGTFYQNETWGPAFWIQRAVLKEFGYPEIKTLDQFFDLVQDYMRKYPQIDGQDTVGFVILTDEGRDWPLRNAPAQLAGYPNDGSVIVDKVGSAYNARLFQHLDISKRYFKKINEMYHAGVVDPESFVMNYDQYISKLSSGRVLGLFDQRWNFNNANLSLYEQEKFDRMYTPIPVVFDESITDWYLTRSELNVNSGFAISENAKDPDKIMKIIDALLDEEWQKLLQWGEQGVDFLVDENGMYYRTQEMRDNYNSNEWRLRNQARDLLEFLPKMEGTFSSGNATSPGIQPSEYFEGLTDSERELLSAYGVQTQGQLFTTPPENPIYFPAWSINIPHGSAEQIANQRLKDIAFEHLPQMIRASTSEFEQRWARYVELNEAIDIAAIEAHYNKEIQRRVDDWGPSR